MPLPPPTRMQESTDCNEDDNGTEQVLGTSMQGVQSSFSAAYSTLHELSQRFQTSLGTTQALLAQVLKSSLHVASNLEAVSGGICLTASITNVGQMPIANVLCNLSFERPPDSNHKGLLRLPMCETTWSLVSCTAIMNNGHQEEKMDAPSLFDAPLAMLPPGARYVHVVHIKSDAPVQCNGILTTTFAGVGETLRTIHRFGVYLIDQIVKEPLHKESQQQREPPLYVREYFVEFIQGIFGAGPGTDLLLRPYQAKDDKHNAICRIQASDSESSYAHIEFAAESNQGHQLLAALVEELDMLNNSAVENIPKQGTYETERDRDA